MVKVRRVVSWRRCRFKPRSTLPQTAFTLPARYYTDAALFERERERFYRADVGRRRPAVEIPQRGDYVTRDIAGDSLIVVRTDADRVRRVLQRLPASRHAVVRGRVGHVRRLHPVSVPRVDVRL